jgi:hypothetical protein
MTPITPEELKAIEAEAKAQYLVYAAAVRRHYLARQNDAPAEELSEAAENEEREGAKLKACNEALNEARTRVDKRFFKDRPYIPAEAPRPGETMGDVAYVRELRQMLASRVPNILKKLVQQAEAGDTMAAKVILDKILPPMKPVEATVRVNLPEHVDRAEGVFQAITEGQLGISQGSELLRAVASVEEARATQEYAARLARLEQRAANGPSVATSGEVLRIPLRSSGTNVTVVE